MPFDLDRHAGLDSPMHRLEPRCRLIGLAALIAGFAWVRDPILVIPALVIAASLLQFSALPAGFVIRRLRVPAVFVLLLGLMLPLVSGGPVIWQFGPFAVHGEGIRQMLVIIGKAAAIVTTGLVLFGCAPLPVNVRTMQRLGLPALLADMTLFSLRYVNEIGADLETMQTAAGLRAFRWKERPTGAPSRLSVFAALVGSLFVSSHARAEQVHRAMMLRGYASAMPRTRIGRPNAASVSFAVLACALGASFLIVQIYLVGGAS